MKFGITWAKIDEIDFIARAEALGYTHLWVTDSQMIRSDCFAVLAAAALKTHTMVLGTGVAVPGLRLAPVVANGIATINRLAPGRTFVALGTGNTGMRMLGRRPMRLKDFAAYIKVVKGLIRGEEVDYPDHEVSHKIRFSRVDQGYINIADRILLYVAGDGPKAQALAGELADGLTTTTLPRPKTVDEVMTNVRIGADRAERTLEDFFISAHAKVAVLEPGEAVNSDRVVDEFGPGLMSRMHQRVDRYLEAGEDPPDFLKPVWKDYLEFHMNRPAELRQQMMHESHNAYMHPAERRFVTAEMLKNFCVVGRPEEVVDQLRELERQGVSEIKCNFPVDRGYAMMEDFSRNVIQRM